MENGKCVLQVMDRPARKVLIKRGSKRRTILRIARKWAVYGAALSMKSSGEPVCPGLPENTANPALQVCAGYRGAAGLQRYDSGGVDERFRRKVSQFQESRSRGGYGRAIDEVARAIENTTCRNRHVGRG